MYISSIPVYSISCLHIEKDFDSLSIFWSLPANSERHKKLEICFDSSAKHYSIELEAVPRSLLFAKITYPANELSSDNCSNVRNLIKNTGLYIIQLTISRMCKDGNEKSISLGIIDDLLTPILNDCPNLNSLCLKEQTLRIIKDMSFPVNCVLNRLELVNCHIQGKFLSTSSCSVSGLDILRLDNCKPIYATGEVMYGRCGVAINMTSTSINTIYLENIINEKDFLNSHNKANSSNRVFFKVSTVNPEKIDYFCLDPKESNPTPKSETKENYLKTYEDELFTYSIECNSLNRVVIQNASFSHETKVVYSTK